MTVPPAHSDRYDQALLWAAQLHRGQFRKGKAVPCISHLISVSALVWEDGGNEDQAIAGLLHDAIEDAGQAAAAQPLGRNAGLLRRGDSGHAGGAGTAGAGAQRASAGGELPGED